MYTRDELRLLAYTLANPNIGHMPILYHFKCDLYTFGKLMRRLSDDIYTRHGKNRHESGTYTIWANREKPVLNAIYNALNNGEIDISEIPENIIGDILRASDTDLAKSGIFDSFSVFESVKDTGPVYWSNAKLISYHRAHCIVML